MEENGWFTDSFLQEFRKEARIAWIFPAAMFFISMSFFFLSFNSAISLEPSGATTFLIMALGVGYLFVRGFRTAFSYLSALWDEFIEQEQAIKNESTRMFAQIEVYLSKD